MVMLALWFTAVSQTFSLPPGMLSALCYVESAHKPNAIHLDDGGSSSRGICQVKIATARSLGFKGSVKLLMEPKTNMYYAAKLLRYQLDRYEGNTEKAIAAYNAGKHRVNSQGQTMNRHYVGKVMRAWEAGK